MGFPTKNDHFGGVFGVPPFKETPMYKSIVPKWRDVRCSVVPEPLRIACGQAQLLLAASRAASAPSITLEAAAHDRLLQYSLSSNPAQPPCYAQVKSYIDSIPDALNVPTQHSRLVACYVLAI